MINNLFDKLPVLLDNSSNVFDFSVFLILFNLIFSVELSSCKLELAREARRY